MAAKPIRVDSITGVWTYLLSIDWEETWLWVLMTFHLWCTVFTLLSILYKKYYPQIGLFTVYLALAFSSQYINEWAAVNYQLFSNQQYFDSNGMFISFLFSLPLLCNSLVIVIYWMWDLTQAMISLKRFKVKHAKRAEKLKEQQATKSGQNREEGDDDVSTDRTDSHPKNDIQGVQQDKSLEDKKVD